MNRITLLRLFPLSLLAVVGAVGPAWSASPGAGHHGTPIVLTGELTILYGDDMASGRAELLHVLQDQATGKRFNLRFDRIPPGFLRSGQVVTVRGLAQEDLLFHVEDGPEQPGIEVVSPSLNSLAASGEQRTLVIVADFIDVGVSCSIPAIQDLVFTDPGSQSVDDFYQETSCGAVWLTGDVVGPFTIDYASTGLCNLGGWADAADAAAEAAGVSVAAYDRKIYVMPSNSCGFSGFGQVGGSPPTLSWVFYCGNEDSYAHELGHNLGMGHASTPANEYGDTSDVMGAGGWGLRQVNAPHKEQMGWVPPEQVLYVTQSGTYDIAPLEVDGAVAFGPQILRVAKPDTDEYYYLSYRLPLGFDVNLAYTYLNRVTVHRYSGTGAATRTYLLQTLGDGDSFVDSANQLTVTQVAHTDNYATVQIQLVAEPDCPPGGPSQETCSDGVDNDCDGLIDCEDSSDCEDDAVCCTVTQSPESSCADGLDNDCDGLIDCEDSSDCEDDAVCCTVTQSPESSCADGLDNDCDGSIDGDDADCLTPSCSGYPDKRSCNASPSCEWVGNPRNGSCQAAVPCDSTEPSGETSCADGLDNDCDGLTDCADTDDCGNDPICRVDCSTYPSRSLCKARSACRWDSRNDLCVNR